MRSFNEPTLEMVEFEVEEIMSASQSDIEITTSTTTSGGIEDDSDVV